MLDFESRHPPLNCDFNEFLSRAYEFELSIMGVDKQSLRSGLKCLTLSIQGLEATDSEKLEALRILDSIEAKLSKRELL